MCKFRSNMTNTLSQEETFANLDTLLWHEVISPSAELAKNVINSFDFDKIRKLSAYTDTSGLLLWKFGGLTFTVSGQTVNIRKTIQYKAFSL